MKHKIILNQIGFSLIEIMVAISILSVVFIALTYAFPLGLSIIKGSESATIASYLAQDKIEELHSLGYENISIGIIESKQRLSVDSNNYLHYFQRETEVRYLNGNLQVEAADQGMKRLSSTVYYINSTSKQEKSFNITTIISER